MAIKVKKGKTTYWKDGEGALVPISYIPEDERKADKMVSNVLKKVNTFRMKMEKFKAGLESELKDYLSKIASKYGEDWEGNAVIYDFSKQKQIEVKLSKHIVFNEKLQIAKQKIDSCIMTWSENSNKKLVAVINKAFKVDKQGNLDAKRVLELRNLDIKDKDWTEAMELITASMKVDSTKIYYNFKVKDEDGRWKQISLNFSAI